MKKIVLTFLGALALSTSAFSQANSQGSIVIDPYYGYPNFGKSLVNSITDDASNTGTKATGVGPCGLRAEYLIGDKIGVGFDFIYNTNRVKYTDVSTDSTWDGTNSVWQVTTTTNSAEQLMQRIRFQARFNYHFDISNPNLDAYFGVGVGTNNRFRKYWLNDVLQPTDALTNITLLPVSVRVCTGIRYYFTPNIGLNAELGLGGPMISGGISIKVK